MKTTLQVALCFVALSIAATSEAQSLPERLRPTVVSVSTEAKGVFCGGVWVGEHLVWSKSHCFAQAAPPGVVKFNGVGCKGDRAVEAVGDDLLLEVCATAPAIARKATVRPRVGEWVGMWGHPDGVGPFWRLGVFSGADPRDGQLMFNLAAMGGDSGGPVFNSRGEVVCTISTVWQPTMGIAFSLTGCDIPTFKRIK